MGIPTVQFGGTDSGGKLRPKVSFSGTYAGVHSDVTLPADGFAGMIEDWMPEYMTVTSANARRTKNRTVIGYRGRWTVTYPVIDATDRKVLARLVNLNDTMYLYPHSDVTDVRWEVQIVEYAGLMNQLGGRPVAYGPVSITFESVNVYSSTPSDEDHAHFCDSTEGSYASSDEICHFADSTEGSYVDSDEIGHFTPAEE